MFECQGTDMQVLGEQSPWLSGGLTVCHFGALGLLRYWQTDPNDEAEDVKIRGDLEMRAPSSL